MNPEDDKYLQEAREVFARMSPEGRVRFGRYLGQMAKQQGHTFIDLNQDSIDDRLQDPNFLAHKTYQIRQEQPSLLSQLFGRYRRGYGRRVGGYNGHIFLAPSRQRTASSAARQMEAYWRTCSEAIPQMAARSMATPLEAIPLEATDIL